MMGTQSARVWGGAEQEQVTVACLFLVAAVLWRACFSNARKLGVPCSGCGRMRCFSPRYIGQVPVVSDAAAYYYICEQKPCGALLVAHHMVLICPVHI